MGRLDMLFLGGCATRLGNDVGSPDIRADWICCFSVAEQQGFVTMLEVLTYGQTGYAVSRWLCNKAW